MSSQTTPANPFQNLLAAELAVFLPLLNNFLTALQQPGVNTQAVVQDYGKAQLEALGSLPQAETVGINTVAAAAQTQLNTIVTAGAAPEPTPEPTPEPKSAA